MSGSGLLSIKKALILFAILIFPSIAYILITTGKNNFKHLPYFGPKELAANGDTIYHSVKSFKMTNQEGEVISDKDFEGKITVVNFFFASCQTICPKMTGQLQRVQDKFAALRDLKIISFTVDPERDSVKALAAYGKQNLVRPRKWSLLTGKMEDIADLARNSYFAVLVNSSDSNSVDIDHSEKVVLVDKERHIRGIYDGTSKIEIDRLIDEIQVLKAEYHEREHGK